MKVKFVHHLLSSGKNNYSIKHACPYCKLKEDSITPHDHFLTCNESESNKDRCIAKIKACLTLLDTPHTMIAIIIRELNAFYNNSIQLPLNKVSPTLLNIQQHQEAISRNHFAWGRISKQIIDYMDLFYQSTNSKKTSRSWANSIIKINLEVHLNEWKNYCNMIQEVQPNTNKINSQIHQDLIHEVSTLHRHAICLPHEPSKLFTKDITKFTELNTNSLEQWIAIA